MKCSLCGTDLIPGNNTCPSCGALNMSFEQAATPQVNQTDTSAMPQAIEMPQMANQDEEMETLTPPPEAMPQQSQPQEVQVTSQNDPDGDGIIEQFEDLDEGEAEVVNASEDMAAPSLEVENENLTSGASDISASSNVSTYDPTQEQPQEINNEENMPKEAGVNFALPEVKDAAADTQGMDIMKIETKTETVGEELKPVKTKFSLKILKNNSYPRKFVFILLGLVLIIGVLIGSTVFGKKVYTPTASNNKKTNTTKVQHVADGKNNETYVNKYKYKIPDVYDYDKTNGGVIVYGTNDDFRIFIRSLEGNYEYIANAKDSIKKSLENENIHVSRVIESTVGDNNYVLIEALSGIYNRLYGIREGGNSLFYVEILSSDNGYNYGALDVANDIINNVEYVDKNTNMESAQYEDISQIVSTVGDAYNNA